MMRKRRMFPAACPKPGTLQGIHAAGKAGHAPGEKTVAWEESIVVAFSSRITCAFSAVASAQNYMEAARRQWSWGRSHSRTGFSKAEGSSGCPPQCFSRQRAEEIKRHGIGV